MSSNRSPTRPTNIRSMPLCDSDKLAFNEEQQQKILNLRQSPRADHKAIASFVPHQDSSDDAMSIRDLDESPSETRRRREEERDEELRSQTPCSVIAASPASSVSTIPVPDEVIELPNDDDQHATSKFEATEPVLTKKPPIKAARNSKATRDHHYEDIEDDDNEATATASAGGADREEDECQLVRVVEHQIMDTIEVVSIASDRSTRASSLKRDRKTPEKKVTFMSSLEDCCQITPDGKIVKELVGTKYPEVLG